MNNLVVLKTADLDPFLSRLACRYDVYLPAQTQGQRILRKYPHATADPATGDVRPVEPLKVFFSPARERVAEDFASRMPPPPPKPFAAVGVKACDLKALRVQDHVFKDAGVHDPFYLRNREQNLILAADCTGALDTCFCLALGVQPHPQENFDLNFSPVPGGFVVEAAGPKGRSLLQEHSHLFHPAMDADLRARDDQRARVRDVVERNLTMQDIPRQDQFGDIIRHNWGADLWQEEARTCVECGACTAVCPTCHCFLLYDQRDDRRMERLRTWDSCLIKDYARVAGGGNPRRRLWMRLRNRFDKKFDFFPRVAAVYACTGCGRCISACPGKIDIRRILRRLVNRA